MKSVAAADFVERVALTLAKVDECDFEKDPERYRLLARAALTELQKPTPDMISAAYEAVRFDEGWAINSGRDAPQARARRGGTAASQSSTQAYGAGGLLGFILYHYSPALAGPSFCAWVEAIRKISVNAPTGNRRAWS